MAGKKSQKQPSSALAKAKQLGPWALVAVLLLGSVGGVWDGLGGAPAAAQALARLQGEQAAAQDALDACATKSAQPSSEEQEAAVSCAMAWKAQGAASAQAREAFAAAAPWWASTQSFEREALRAYSESSAMGTLAGHKTVLTLITRWGVAAFATDQPQQAQRASILASSLSGQMKQTYALYKQEMGAVESRALFAARLIRVSGTREAKGPLTQMALDLRRQALAEFWQTQHPEAVAAAGRSQTVAGMRQMQADIAAAGLDWARTQSGE